MKYDFCLTKLSGLCKIETMTAHEQKNFNSYIYVFVLQNKVITKPFELLLWHMQSFSCLKCYINFCLSASV